MIFASGYASQHILSLSQSPVCIITASCSIHCMTLYSSAPFQPLATSFDSHQTCKSGFEKKPCSFGFPALQWFDMHQEGYLWKHLKTVSNLWWLWKIERLNKIVVYRYFLWYYWWCTVVLAL